jgi:N-methylhydantoinase A
VPLDIDLARAGVQDIAGKLGLSEAAAASGIVEIAAWNQANALRQVTVKRGLDVRDFHLVTFGGSGSLVACRLVDILGLRGVVVPLNPGNLSAYGLLTVDVRNDYVRTAVTRQSQLQAPAVQQIVDDLTCEAGAALSREGFHADVRRFERTADLRYFGQAYEVRVPLSDGPVAPATFAEVANAFHEAHQTLYGYDFRDDSRQEVEWVNLRVTGIGPIRKPEVVEIRIGSGARSAVTGSRQVFFEQRDEATIYDRSRLGCGDVVKGPAVVEEFSSTVPISPGFDAEVDRFGNLVLRRTSGRTV